MTSHNLKLNGGYSLIEVMVALVVLSIGLLGLAALQTIGMRFNHESYGRTQAAFQVYDIVDRMRVNRAFANGNAHANYDSVVLAATGTSSDCVSNACTSAELADDDVFSWKTATSSLLSQGQAGICRGSFNANFTSCTVNATGVVYHIVVRWTENGSPVTFEAQTQL